MDYNDSVYGNYDCKYIHCGLCGLQILACKCIPKYNRELEPMPEAARNHMNRRLEKLVEKPCDDSGDSLNAAATAYVKGFGLEKEDEKLIIEVISKITALQESIKPALFLIRDALDNQKTRKDRTT